MKLSTENIQSVHTNVNDDEDPEFIESTSNRTESDNLDLPCGKDIGMKDVSPKNKIIAGPKENVYDIKNVLNLNNNSESSCKSRKIRCFCDEEFRTIFDLIPHLKFCEKSKDIKWSPFVKWTGESLESENELKAIIANSEIQEALDLSKKPTVQGVEEGRTISNNSGDSESERLKWHCPECKFICSNKTLLLEHFDCEHKEVGSFSCTCGHISEWLPTFLRHYIVCNVAATDLQDERKEEFINRSEPIFNHFDIDALNKCSNQSLVYPKSYSNRWDIPFNLLPNISHQFINNWLDPQSHDLNHTPGYHRCQWCHSGFTSSIELANHSSKCNIKPSLKSYDKSPFRLDFMKSGTLPFPHPSIPLSSFTDRHIATTNSVATCPQPEAVRLFKCSHCIKSFKSKALLDQHMHIHYPPKYTCRYCGKKYRWPPVFYHHQRTCKKRPAVPSTAIQSSGVGSLSSSNSTAATITTSTSTYLTNNQLSNSSTFYGQPQQCPPQNKSSPSNLLLNVPSPFLPNPMLTFSTKPSFPGVFPVANIMACICGHRMENFPSYLSHINCCPMFIHMSSKQRSENSPPIIPNQLNSINFKANSSPLDHNPFLPSNGLLMRPSTQTLNFQNGYSSIPNKSKMSPPVSNNPTPMPPNFLKSSDSIMAALVSSVGIPKNSNYLSESFAMNLLNQHSSMPSSQSAHSIPLSINNFEHLMSQESPRLTMPSSPPFNPALHSHHYHYGVGKSCSQCGKEFSSRLSLKQHIEGKHSAEGKYQCPSCSKRYRWGASYYYHKKSCIASKDSPNSLNPSPTMTEIIFD